MTVKTNDLINALVADSAPKVSFGRVYRGLVIAAFLLAAGLFAVAIGPRADFAVAVTTVRFDFKFVVTLALATSAVFAAYRMARPGVPLGRFGWLLLAAPLLLAGGAAAELMAMPEATWLPRLVGSNSRLCLTVVPLLAIGPLALILFALRKGAPTRPALAGAVAGLAASGIAATFYAANCTDDSPLFVATWYPLATAIVVTAGALIGSRVLRW